MSESPRKTNSALRVIEVLLTWIGRIFDTGAVVALLAIVAVVLYQILARYALPRAPVWTEELSRYLFAYTIVLASGAVIVHKRHVRLELFHHKLSERAALGYGIIGYLIVGVFALWLLPFAWDYAAIGRRQTSPAMGVNLTWVFASTVFFFGLVSLVSLLLATRDAIRLVSGGKE